MWREALLLLHHHHLRRDLLRYCCCCRCMLPPPTEMPHFGLGFPFPPRTVLRFCGTRFSQITQPSLKMTGGSWVVIGDMQIGASERRAMCIAKGHGHESDLRNSSRIGIEQKTAANLTTSHVLIGEGFDERRRSQGSCR